MYIGKGNDVTYSNLYIGNYMNIGKNATFMSTRAKIIIGKVAAGAIVTHDIKEYSIVAGIPVREIGNRKDL